MKRTGKPAQPETARLWLLLGLVGLGGCGGASSQVGATGGAEDAPTESPAAPHGSPGPRIDPNRGLYGTRLDTPAEARNSYAPFISMLVPGYTVRVAADGEPEDPWDPGKAVEQGLVWSVPFIFEGDGAWRHGFALSFAQYMQSRRQEGRGTYRLRLLSIGESDPVAHLWLGAGGFFDEDVGVGPRGELAWVFGELGRGSAMLLMGWQYAAQVDEHAFEVAVAAFVPYVFR